jgi:hypothetical protein
MWTSTPDDKQILQRVGDADRWKRVDETKGINPLQNPGRDNVKQVKLGRKQEGETQLRKNKG